MSKNLTLPQTKVETAEQRLEELVENKSITRYSIIFEGENYWHFYPVRGETRAYPDGFELIYKDGGKEIGMLHIGRRRAFIEYSLENEHEKQRGVE